MVRGQALSANAKRRLQEFYIYEVEAGRPGVDYDETKLSME
jgi:hypothetical protein